MNSEEYIPVNLNIPDAPPPAFETLNLETPEETQPSRTPRRGGGFSVMSEKRILIGIGVVVGLIAAVLAIILPISFSTLEYYELGFQKRKSSGSVDTSKVYSSGRHLVGPDTTFKPFPADAHFVDFTQVTVFTSDKLQVSISARFQYFLRPHQLHLLHKNFDIHYKDVLKNNALDAMKGRATLFSTREYIRQRMTIEQELFKSIRDRLGGICCEKDCKTDGTNSLGRGPCVPNCKSYSSCQEEDFGLFAEVRYFQLAALDIPSDLGERFLQALVLQEENEAEKHKQNAEVVRKQTESLVKQYQNNALEISRNADSQSSLIISKAEANATAIVERARMDGLKHLYSEIGLTTNQHKLSFDYLRTLTNKKDVSLAVDFNQLIAGPLSNP